EIVSDKIPLSSPEALLRAFLGSDSLNYDLESNFSRTYPEQATTAHFGIFRNRKTDIVKKIVVDASGVPTSPAVLQQNEMRLRRARFGVLSKELFHSLQLNSSGKLSVTIAYSFVGIAEKKPVNPLASRQEVDAAFAMMRAQRKAHLADTRKRVISLLASLGGNILSVPDTFPVIRARISAQVLLSFAQYPYTDITKRTDILSISQQRSKQTKGELSFCTTGYCYGANDLEAEETFTSTGAYATGIKVGIIELSCFQRSLWHTHPALASVGSYNQLSSSSTYLCAGIADGLPCQGSCSGFGVAKDICLNGVCVNWHATAVRSQIGSHVSPNSPRLAKDISTYYANTGYHVGAWSWFDQHAVQVVNQSASGLAPNAANWAARNDYITITHAAGNRATMPAVDCYPNAICVGAARITSPSYVDSWKNDPTNIWNRYYVAPSFNYVNGYHGNHPISDMEKPDILAIDNTLSLDVETQGWTPIEGTSFAAPKIAGLVALLQEYAPFTSNWPEVVRPMIMASALFHDVELGKTRDGAGIPVASILTGIALNHNYHTGVLTASDFSTGEWTLSETITIPALKKLRVVLSWMYCSPDAGSDDTIFQSADFDLYVYEATTGVKLGESTSYHNNIEMIDLGTIALWPRTVRVGIRLYGQMLNCNAQQREFFGLAWSTR
ncbi:MAG: S8 family serine peptidase, partial [Deltaproteobacteria bacterium]|nr:S8 family serine peptidase [Deltaproteobacteria bacterium]